MKILQISTGFDIDFNGGITNYVRNISDTLVENGHDVTVLYSNNNGSVKDHKFKSIYINPLLKPFHLKSVIYNKDIFLIESIVKKLNPDIIHVHMMIDLPLQVLEVFKKYSKVVISLHDYSFICNRIVLLDRFGKICDDNNANRKCEQCISFEETIENKLIGGSIRRLGKILNIDKIANSSGHHKRFLKGQELFDKADTIIAVSNRVKELYENNGYTNKKFEVNHIGNYTAEDDFRNNFKNRKSISKSEKIKFGFIGSLSHQKGSDLFIQLAKSSQHEFHIYGGIDPKVLELIKEMPNVFYHGRYTHNQLTEILMNIDFGLVLSIWEDNAPQVVFEFLNAGIPIIGTRMGGIPDFVNDTNGVLFRNNKEELSRIIEWINSDEIYNFYNKVINTFLGTKKAQQHMDEILEIYNQIL